jgi:parallel beta-helix repeat protein
MRKQEGRMITKQTERLNVVGRVALAAGILAILLFAFQDRPRPAFGAEYTVTTTADSGAGSLRQAILDANDNSGTDTIDFNIPTGSDPGCDAGTHLCTISPTSGLPTIAEAVTIDGTTQPVTNVIRLDGSSASGAAGLYITASDSTVQGLMIYSFPSNGIVLDGAANTTIVGNVISANGESGVYISGAGASGNVLTGNIIGADVTGMVDNGNAGDGVWIDGAPDNSVGVPSADPGTGNLISGNDGAGVHISGAGAEGNKVQHNGIGVALDLVSALGNESHGVWIDGSDNNLVGGTASVPDPAIPPNPWVAPDTLNIIAHNGDAGVFVDGSGNSIRANNIYDNASLGIDVSPSGHSTPFSDAKVTSALWTPTPYWVADTNGNTVIDPDELQWVPEVIATGYVHGGWADTGVVVEGFVSSTSTRDPSGYGEGEEWEAGGDTAPPDPPPFHMGADGTMSVAGSFLSDDPVFVPGQYFTDTVTKCEEGHPEGGCIGNGTTLEFSNSVEIVADADGDGIADQVDTLPSGPYSHLFSDGTTTGTLNPVGTSGRNGCKVSVVDLAPPDGVILGGLCLPNPAKPSGFEGPAHIEVCEGVKKHRVDLENATSTTAKCGSAEFSVGYGPVFVGVGTMSARLPTAAEVRFNDPVDGNHEIVNGGTSPTIWVGGVLIGPGETVTVHDTDSDAMADAYETAHACLDFEVNDAEADPDGDHLNNLQEAERGTDPCVANAAVGGIAELPDIGGTSADDAGTPGDGSGWSASGYAALAGGLAAVAFAIAVGGWYARRRWHKA